MGPGFVAGAQDGKTGDLLSVLPFWGFSDGFMRRGPSAASVRESGGPASLSAQAQLPIPELGFLRPIGRGGLSLALIATSPVLLNVSLLKSVCTCDTLSLSAGP